MKKTAIAIAAGIIAAGTVGLTSAQAPEKIKYPANYLKGTLYATVDRPDTKQ